MSNQQNDKFNEQQAENLAEETTRELEDNDDNQKSDEE